MALGDNSWLSHSALDSLWMEFGDDTSLTDGTKADKAQEMVQKISKKPSADNDFLEIINDAFFLDSKAEQRQKDLPFSRLKKALQDAEFGLTEDGFTFPIGSEAHAKSPNAPQSVPTQQTATELWENTVDWASAPTFDNAPEKAKTSMPKNRDDRSVFIVHGRDLYNRDALASLLKKMDIRPLSWTDAEEHAEAHETLKIVEAGLEVAQAVIVLFTPDDEARLHPRFHKEGEPSYEIEPTGQARPNVILEAGMAYAKDPARTIFACIGNLRPISDIAGIHFVNLDNEWDSRLSLRTRLRKAGVRLDLNADLTAHDAGTFGPPPPKMVSR